MTTWAFIAAGAGELASLIAIAALAYIIHVLLAERATAASDDACCCEVECDCVCHGDDEPDPDDDAEFAAILKRSGLQ